METSYQNVQRNSQEPLYESKDTSINLCGRITIAVAIIILVGSVIANGCLYAQLRAYSFAIGGPGVALFVLLMFAGCASKTTVTVTRQPYTSAPQPPPRPRESREFNDPLIQKKQEDKKEEPPQIQPTPKSNPPPLKNPPPPPPKKKQPTPPPSPPPMKKTAPPPQKPQPLPPLPPMPPIFGIQLPPKHDLLNSISTVRFLKPSEKQHAITFAFGAVLAGQDAGEELFGDHRFDGDLLNFPLDAWINNGSYLGNERDTVAKDPNRKDNIALIEERITHLEQLIQLKERLKRFQPGTFKVRDLLGNWNTLKCRFMSEGEFNGLTVASIAQEKDPAVIENILGKRIRERAKATPNFTPPANFDKQKVDAILLSDLPKIKAAHINTNPEHFPLLTFLLMDPNELKDIELKSLTEDQLRFVLTKENAKHFTSAQINSVISKVKDFIVFAHLNEDQKLNFDFPKIVDDKVRKEAFGIIYDKDAQALFEKMDLPRIYTFIPLFDRKHYSAISKINKHVVAWDFTLWKENARKDVFGLVYDGNISECFEMLDIKRIYEFLPWFDYKHYAALKKVEKHVLVFDFFQIPNKSERASNFDLFFDYGADKLFAKMDLQHIYRFLPLFTHKQWFILGNVEKHVLAFDYLQIPDAELRKTVFRTFYDKNAKGLFAKQNLNRIYEFLPWFDNTHWFALDDLEDYIVAFDYSRIDPSIRGTICSWWFPVGILEPTERASRRLSKLSSAQKDAIRGYADKRLLKYLN